jgi:hypothetical protein
VREAEPAQAGTYPRTPTDPLGMYGPAPGDSRPLTADEMDDAARYFKGFKPEKMRFVADRFQIRSHDGRVLLDSGEAPRAPVESDPSGLPLSASGAKADAGKVLGGLLLDFAHALELVAEVGTHGAEKYSRGGWVAVPDGEQRYLDAAIRHLLKLGKGEQDDADSGLPHLAHIAWNFLAVLDLQQRELAHDD